MKHIISTLFNVKSSSGGVSRQDPGWLDWRLDLFDRFSWPSITEQTDQDFEWLMFTYGGTPPKHLDILQSYERKYDNLTLVFVPPDWQGVLRTMHSAFAERSTEGEITLTTRHEPDDALGLHVIRETKKRMELGHFMCPKYGYMYDEQNDILYPHCYPKNCYIGYAEVARENGAIESVHKMSHAKIEPVIYICGDRPSWILTLHNDTNLDYYVKDHHAPVDMSVLKTDFAVRDIL